MKLKNIGWLGLMLFVFNAHAQIAFDPDWQESEVPPPPSFNKNGLIPIEMPRYASLRFGVDPATLAITSDGIVRYVVVASNTTGSLSAMYEGIRCATGEVKTYARYASNGQWSSIQTPKWQDLDDNLPSKHALALARQGVCNGRSATANSVAQIIRTLSRSGQQNIR